MPNPCTYLRVVVEVPALTAQPAAGEMSPLPTEEGAALLRGLSLGITASGYDLSAPGARIQASTIVRDPRKDPAP